MLRNRSLSSAFHGFVSAVQNQVHTSMYTYIHENTHTHTHSNSLALSRPPPPPLLSLALSLSHTMWQVARREVAMLAVNNWLRPSLQAAFDDWV